MKKMVAEIRSVLAPLAALAVFGFGLRALYENVCASLNQRGVFYHFADKLSLFVNGVHPGFFASFWLVVWAALFCLMMLVMIAVVVDMAVRGGYTWADVAKRLSTE